MIARLRRVHNNEAVYISEMQVQDLSATKHPDTPQLMSLVKEAIQKSIGMCQIRVEFDLAPTIALSQWGFDENLGQEYKGTVHTPDTQAGLPGILKGDISIETAVLHIMPRAFLQSATKKLFYARDEKGKMLVVKRFLRSLDKSAKDYHREAQAQTAAQMLAVEFNKKLPPHLLPVDCVPLQVFVPFCDKGGSSEPYFVEPFVRGKGSVDWLTVQAFAHFSWAQTDGELLALYERDPQGQVHNHVMVHTRRHKPLRLSSETGMKEFLKHHRCNDVCRAVGLHSVQLHLQDKKEQPVDAKEAEITTSNHADHDVNAHSESKQADSSSGSESKSKATLMKMEMKSQANKGMVKTKCSSILCSAWVQVHQPSPTPPDSKSESWCHGCMVKHRELKFAVCVEPHCAMPFQYYPQFFISQGMPEPVICPLCKQEKDIEVHSATRSPQKGVTESPDFLDALSGDAA